MTPRERGWRLPAAWHPPGRFWTSWPAAEDEREDCLDLVTLLSEYAPVTILANPEDVAEVALRTPCGVAAMPAVHAPGDIRSAAPRYLVDGAGHLAGGLACGSPAACAMLDCHGLDGLNPPPGLLDGGIDIDGEGTALLPDHGTAGRDRAASERQLAEWLGIERVLWVPGERVELCARFLAPGLVAATGPAAAALAAAGSDARGRALTVVELPAPRNAGDNGARSYVDLVLAGNLALVPVHDGGHDREVFDRLAAVLPGRRLIPVDAGPNGLSARVAVQPATAEG